jgi:trehalose synthase
MLPLVRTNHQKLEDYRELISGDLFEEITRLAKDLKNLRVFQVNATPRGGGVAELLRSLVPLMKGIGIKTEWYTIPPREDFFKITKEIHNALQGKEYVIPFWQRVRYLEHIERSASLMRDMKPDVWVIHDPQPAGVILYLPHFHPAICRIHIDLTLPNPEAWKFFSGIFGMYDKIILSSKRFIKEEIKEKAVVFPPAIDPLAHKNQPLNLDFSKEILKSYGINPSRPLVSQVSRFDPWKGFLELIEAYQIVKKKIPDLQLALVGFFLAKDDPEAMKVYNLVKEKAEKDPDIFLFFDPEMLGSLEVHVFVNAIQVASEVIVQNSTREGFGLSLTEAMWKRKAVVGGPAEGMKLQIQNNKNGFLSSSSQELAKRIIQLIKNPQLAEKLGKAAKANVKGKFLMPRLLRDYLKIFKELV